MKHYTQLSFPRWLFPVLVILLLVGVVVLQRHRHPESPPPVITCTDLHDGCGARLDGRQVRLGVTGELKALVPFGVWVKAPGARKVQASFAMKDMDMGFNLYTLRPDSTGVFRSRVTLPVCVSGRHDWIMILDIDGRKLSVPFVTRP